MLFRFFIIGLIDFNLCKLGPIFIYKKIHIDWFMKYNVAETDNHFFVTALNDNVKLQNYNTSCLVFICQDKTKTLIMDSISMK